MNSNNLNNFNNLKLEILGIIILIIIYWYFNIKNSDVLVVNTPIEKLSNVSIFDGNEI